MIRFTFTKLYISDVIYFSFKILISLSRMYLNGFLFFSKSLKTVQYKVIVFWKQLLWIIKNSDDNNEENNASFAYFILFFPSSIRNIPFCYEIRIYSVSWVEYYCSNVDFSINKIRCEDVKHCW